MRQELDALKPETRGGFERMGVEMSDIRDGMEDFRTVMRRVAAALVGFREEVRAEFKETVRKDQLETLAQAMDDFSAEVRNNRSERRLWEDSYRRHEHRLQDHEARLLRQEARKS